MANKLNFTGLSYFYNRIKTIFALKEDVPTDLSDLTNTGQDPYATESYVDENGGKIDAIKVNGTTQTITNKTVDIPVPTDLSDLTNTGNDPYAQMSDLPTDLSDLTNTGNDPYAQESDLPTDLSDLTNTGADPYAQMSDVESAVVGALKPKGSVTFANLPALTAANLNSMYNVTDSFTTTSDFVEGAGVTYPAGTNVAIINTGTDASPVYKYDTYGGVVDLSGYWSKSELVAITTAQIDSLFE